MGGHATHDEREARDTFAPALFEQWGRRDPVGLYEEYLKSSGWTEADLAGLEAEVTTAVEAAERDALASREAMPEGRAALDGVYAENDER